MKKDGKMTKINLLECYKKIRKFWKIKPQTKILPNKKKKYNRGKVKQQFKKEY